MSTSVSRPLEEVEFTLFDTETTGLDSAQGDRIVEIAAMRFMGTHKIAEFQSLVNPQRALTEAAQRVNGITEAMLADAPPMKSIMPKFIDFIQGSCLCAYNAPFDMSFLEAEMRALSLPALQNVIVVDILAMARRILPRIERYALWFVSQYLGMQEQQRHRAFSDVEITYKVFQRLVEIVRAKGIIDSESFFRLFALSYKDFKDEMVHRIAQLQEAIDTGVRLRLRYLSRMNAEVTEREVIPKQIRRDRAQVYLVGFCNLRQEERTFRVDGILHIENV